MADHGPDRPPALDLGAEPVVVRQSSRHGRPRGSGLRERVAGLFPLDAPRPATQRAWMWMLLIVIGGALVSLGRVPRGPGLLNTIWAEDGSDFLTDALNRPLFAALARPLNGYFVTVPRLLAEPASLAPVKWEPAVLTIEAALVTALMAVAVYVASRAHLKHTLARLVAAVPVIAVPVGENVAAATSNNVATLQFAAVYTALWMVLWTSNRRSGLIVASGVVLAVALSTFLVVVVLPLAVLRLYGRRDKTSLVMVGSLLLGVTLNVMALALHLTARPTPFPSRWDPGWALQSLAEWALPHAMFGYRISGRGAQAVDPAWLGWVAWLILLAVLIVAAARLTGPKWALAAIMGIHAAVLVCATIMQLGGLELRYVVAPELMLFAGMAALLLPRFDRPERARWLVWGPLVGLTAFVAFVFATSYVTANGPRATLQAWDQAVDKARAVCADSRYGGVYIYTWSSTESTVTPVPVGTRMPDIAPTRGPVLVPCDRLR